MTSGGRANDHRKRGTFPFKTLFDSSRYDSRLPSYRRAKGKVIFDRLLSPSLSRLVSLTYPKLETSAIPGTAVMYAFPGKYIGQWATSQFVNITPS